GKHVYKGSLSSGIDIEFVGRIDGMKKYCQIKAGPETISYETDKLSKKSQLSVNCNFILH
ncbi:MAG TPA: hypothetical protein K8V64_02150, partial [Enterococcus durans]|nr:hypothetical protein [Enterococcus durans]